MIRSARIIIIIYFVLMIELIPAAWWISSESAAASSGNVNYSYDSLGRITQETYPANSAAFAYDNAGNRTATTQN